MLLPFRKEIAQQRPYQMPTKPSPARELEFSYKRNSGSGLGQGLHI